MNNARVKEPAEPDETKPARKERPDKPVEFPVSETAVPQADGVP